MKFYVYGENPSLVQVLRQLVGEAEFMPLDHVPASLDAPLVWEGKDCPFQNQEGVALVPYNHMLRTSLRILHKPVAPNHLRRSLYDAWDMFSKRTVALGPVLFDPQKQTLQGETVVHLTDKESELLAFLCDHPNQPLDRTDILRNLWGYGEGVDTNTLETHIYRVRQKLRQADPACALLTTQEDGYVLALH